MSKYTITLDEYCSGLYLADHPSYNVIQQANMSKADYHQYGRTLFPASFPFWGPPAEMTAFEDRFLDHFRFQEIAYETIARFKWELENWLEESMPYYIKLKASEIDLNDLFKDIERTVYETEDLNSSKDREGSRDLISSRTVERNENENADAAHNYQRQHGTDNTTIVEGATYQGIKPVNDGSIIDISKEHSDNSQNNRSIDITNEQVIDKNRGIDESQEEAVGEISNDNEQGESHRVKGTTESGYSGVDRAERIMKYREALLHLYTQIFAEAKVKLFMLLR